MEGETESEKEGKRSLRERVNESMKSLQIAL